MVSNETCHRFRVCARISTVFTGMTGSAMFSAARLAPNDRKRSSISSGDTSDAILCGEQCL